MKTLLLIIANLNGATEVVNAKITISKSFSRSAPISLANSGNNLVVTYPKNKISCDPFKIINDLADDNSLECGRTNTNNAPIELIIQNNTLT